MLISLCHATYYSTKKPLEIKNLWIERAIGKDLIEYIPGFNSDDYESYKNTSNIKRFIRPKTNLCTAVDNWNGSAKLAKGDLIFVIADDLIPPYGWDIKIKELINGLSPKKHAFAIKINDSKLQNDKKLRHPIISRKFYEKYGLFDNRFRGVFCDDDITKRAFWKAMILDGRLIKVIHNHPFETSNKSLKMSISNKLINSEEEYEYGFSIIQKIWRHRKLIAPIFLLKRKSKFIPTFFFIRIVIFLRILSNLLVICNLKLVLKAIIAKFNNRN